MEKIKESVLYDESETAKVRHIGLMGENARFDLTCVFSSRNGQKIFILNRQSGRFAACTPEELQKKGFLEHALQMNEEDARELRAFLATIVSS